MDTSVWIEHLRATGSWAHLRLAEAIAAGPAVVVTEPVVMEVLAGARTAQELARHTPLRLAA